METALKNIVVFTSVLSVLTFSPGIFAMSLKDVGKLCLFSAISGVITLDGKPVSAAQIKRTVGKAHTQGEKTDETYTDADGYFEMPSVWDRSLIGKVLPMEFAVPQEVFVYADGQEYKIWSGVKRRKEEFSESSGQPLVVRCELKSEKRIVNVGGGFVSSVCEWNYKEDPQPDFGLPIDD